MPHKPTIEIAFTPEFKRNLHGIGRKEFKRKGYLE